MSDSFQSGNIDGPNRGSKRSVAALFDSRADAERAVENLVEDGFDRSDIRMMPGNERDTASGSSASTDTDTSFWSGLRDFFFPEEDRELYAEGLHRGGYLVSVRTTDTSYERAIDILDDEGTIDLDEREASWRSEGWTGYAGADRSSPGSSASSAASGFRGGTAGDLSSGDTTGVGAASLAADTFGSGEAARTDRTGVTDDTSTGLMGSRVTGQGSVGSTGASAGSSTAGADLAATSGLGRSGDDASLRSDSTGREEVIPIAEEHLRVGKRMTEGGRVRVRSYVVEEPVTENVSLRQEHVNVERRPVDRALTGNEDAFRDRTIELDEQSEEAVVSKEARIREELVVNKDVETREQTISDTVRHTEVEVEDDRNNRTNRTGTTDTDLNRR